MIYFKSNYSDKNFGICIAILIILANIFTRLKPLLIIAVLAVVAFYKPSVVKIVGSSQAACREGFLTPALGKVTARIVLSSPKA
jgi:hypothetical protein